jgi:regulator of nucleoside diphosphate kinase
MMKDHPEIILSMADAALLRSLLGERSNALLRRAQTCAPEHLPADRIGIGSKVVYLEEPWHIRRSVTLCHPDDADGRLDRLSVTSPQGLALVGRRPGSMVMSALPNGWPFTVRVVEVARSSEKEAA